MVYGQIWLFFLPVLGSEGQRYPFLTSSSCLFWCHCLWTMMSLQGCWVSNTRHHNLHWTQPSPTVTLGGCWKQWRDPGACGRHPRPLEDLTWVPKVTRHSDPMRIISMGTTRDSCIPTNPGTQAGDSLKRGPHPTEGSGNRLASCEAGRSGQGLPKCRVDAQREEGRCSHKSRVKAISGHSWNCSQKRRVSVRATLLRPCPTLCYSMDCSLRGILQASVLEWVAMPSWLRDWTHISYISCISRQVIYHSATWEAHEFLNEAKLSYLWRRWKWNSVHPLTWSLSNAPCPFCHPLPSLQVQATQNPFPCAHICRQFSF